MAATIKHHLSQHPDEIAEKIQKSLYVDNIATGETSIKSALDFYYKSKSIFTEAHMNLREWTSNCKEFVDQLPDEDKAGWDPCKLFGYIWMPKEDTIRIADLKPVGPITTKRKALQLSAKIFDPMGFTSPITLQARLKIQDLWKSNVTWDEKLLVEITEDWKSIEEDLKMIAHFKFTRHIGDKISHILCFTDASKKAYSTNIYVKTQLGVFLNFSKNRLAPLKEAIDMPRMELLGVVIGVRSLLFSQEGLDEPQAKLVLWSDSKVVLAWIASTKQLSVWVTNRICQVLYFITLS